MRRLVILFLLVFMLFSINISAFAEGEPVSEPKPVEVATSVAECIIEPEPIAEPAEVVEETSAKEECTEPISEPEPVAPTEDMLILNSAIGVPDTLRATFSINGIDVAVVQGCRLVNAEAFPANEKTFLKIRLEGEGRLVGAKFDFQPFEVAPILPPIVEPVIPPVAPEEPVLSEAIIEEQFMEEEFIKEQPIAEPLEEEPIINPELAQNPDEQKETTEPEVTEGDTTDISESEDITENQPVKFEGITEPDEIIETTENTDVTEGEPEDISQGKEITNVTEEPVEDENSTLEDKDQLEIIDNNNTDLTTETTEKLNDEGPLADRTQENQ